MNRLPPFKLHQPSDIAEAGALLARFGDDGRAYAGGTELLLAMKQSALSYGHLVDVKTIPGLRRIERADGVLRIGATATHREIERSDVVRRSVPALAAVAERVANARVRAAGTIGGNLCFAEPHSDLAALLLALEARCRVQGVGGSRVLGLDELIVGPYATALAQDELLVSVDVPVRAAARRATYRKYQFQERPTVGIALVLDTAQDGTISSARVAVGSASPVPRRSARAESLLTGTIAVARARLAEAAAALADDSELLDDADGSAEYKAQLIRTLLQRCFAELTAERVAA